MDKALIEKHLYNDSIPQAVRFVASIDDEESLYAYANEYNWDNGFEVPEAILQNKNCSLSIALLLFHYSDGVLFLQDRESAEGTKAWFGFVRNLYKKILSGSFPQGTVPFNPQLSRVQEFKLRKILSKEELVFITPITQP